MKSRTSFFNKTIFKKNLTRFAPAWGLYTIYLLLGLISIFDSGSTRFAPNLCDLVDTLCMLTPCYALLCTQLLFGDLYNARMCFSLHALPLRRETWFCTHILSGFALHLIPTGIFAVLSALYALLDCYPGDWLAAVLWLLGVNLQFMCFFGIAVLSAFCVGSRFAQAVVYGILNFAATLAGWVLDTVIVPMYYGIRLNLDPILWFSPMGQMMEEPFLNHTRGYSSSGHITPGNIVPGENFLYYFIVAALGIGLLFLALQLYRRRNLEYAGDFIAFPKLAPGFLVVYTIIVGTTFHFISDDLMGNETCFFLFFGLAVGWFTGKMLLERTPRVFGRRNILRCGVMMAACALTLVVANLDPLGIESWIPEEDEVESVTIAEGHYGYHEVELTLEDPEDIQRIIAIHRQALEDHLEENIAIPAAETWEITAERIREYPETMDYSMSFTLTYQFPNGTTRSRYYNIWMGGEDGQYLRKLFSSPEAVFGEVLTVEEFQEKNSFITIRDIQNSKDINIFTSADIGELYQAILADCEEGNMGQTYNWNEYSTRLYTLKFGGGLSLKIFSSCENTLNWLRDYGLDVDALLKEAKK